MYSSDNLSVRLRRLPLDEAVVVQNEALEKSLLKKWKVVDLNKITNGSYKKLFRLGVPHSLRPEVWLKISGGYSLKDKYDTDYYRKFVDSYPANSHTKKIEAHVSGWFSDNAPKTLYKTTSRLVYAYGEHVNASFQSSWAAIASFLITTLGVENDDVCFWIMAANLQRMFSITYVHENTGKLVSVENSVLASIARTRYPKLLSALSDYDCSLINMSKCWFSNMFVGILPVSTVARIWDCALYEGIKILYRVGLALLKKEEYVLQGNLAMCRNISWRISQTIDTDDLFKVAFRGIGPLSMKSISVAYEAEFNHLMKEEELYNRRVKAMLSPHFPCYSTTSEHSGSDTY